jgi:alpha-tubulin suppressor-like RCC1 family protein
LVDFSGVGEIVRASMGKNHTLLLNNQGELFGLGYGGYGAIGTGATEQYDTPQKIKVGAEGHSIVDFDAGKDFSVAVTSNGDVYTWGKSETVPEFINELVARKYFYFCNG